MLGQELAELEAKHVQRMTALRAELEVGKESHRAGNESNDITINGLDKMLNTLKKGDTIHSGPHSPSGSTSIATQTRKINNEAVVKNKNGRKPGYNGTTRTVKPDRKETRKADACHECGSRKPEIVRKSRKILRRLKAILTEDVELEFQDCKCRECGREVPASRRGTVEGTSLDPTPLAIAGTMWHKGCSLESIAGIFDEVLHIKLSRSTIHNSIKMLANMLKETNDEICRGDSRRVCRHGRDHVWQIREK